MKGTIGLSALLAAVILAAPRLEASIAQQSPQARASAPFQRMLGSSVEIIGDALFLKADEYLHGGVTSKFEEHEEAGHEELADAGAAPPRDWIERVNAGVRSAEHRHLSGGELKELLPFFALSTKLDPHNIEAVLASAYWLETRFGKLDEAAGVLEQGIRDNPESWQIEDRLAGLFFRRKNYAACEAHYREALKKTQGKSLEYYELSQIRYRLAECLVLLSKTGEAAEYYRGALEPLRGRNLELEKTIEIKIAELDR